MNRETVFVADSGNPLINHFCHARHLSYLIISCLTQNTSLLLTIIRFWIVHRSNSLETQKMLLVVKIIVRDCLTKLEHGRTREKTVFQIIPDKSMDSTRWTIARGYSYYSCLPFQPFLKSTHCRIRIYKKDLSKFYYLTNIYFLCFFF